MKLKRADWILIHKLIKIHEQKLTNGTRAASAVEHKRARRLLKLFTGVVERDE